MVADYLFVLSGSSYGIVPMNISLAKLIHFIGQTEIIITIVDCQLHSKIGLRKNANRSFNIFYV